MARLALAAPGLDLGWAEPRHLLEPRNKWRGRPGPLARPRSVEEVAAILAAASEARVGVVPFGGGTGLVGGQVAPEGPLPLIVSLERMRTIREIHPGENVIVAEAGVTLDEVREAAVEAGRLFPLHYASSGSATVGGALAVNSGGLNVLRHGMARDLTLGVEAALADGSILRGLTRLRKDNTGYDLRHLLIGSEGTLGIITAAALILKPLPASRATALLAVDGAEAALELLSAARAHSGDMVDAFELIGGTGLGFLAETMPEVRQPFDSRPDWSVLVEIAAPRAVEAEPILMGIIENAMEAGLVSDGHLAQSARQRDDFWALREAIPEANRRIGAIASHDVSLPLSCIAAFLNDTEASLREIAPFRVNTFGHLGDGNLHLNVFPPPGETALEHRGEAEAVTRVVHDAVAAHGGSFSAEHGIGRLKTDDLARYGDPARLAVMRAIKATLDPVGVLNPGAVLGV